MDMKDDSFFIVHFGELWLRGRNRGTYVAKLMRNIKEALPDHEVSLSYDKFIIRGSDREKIRDVLDSTFGVSNYEIVYETKPTLGAISKLSVKLLKKMNAPIKIDAHRSYKGLEFNSVDVIKHVVEAAEKANVKLSIKDYHSMLNINVGRNSAFVSVEKVRGMGGLPVGTSGKGVVLLSGGIDSPVAAWYAMKRGIEPIYLHVHAYPDNEEAETSKISDIIKVLSKNSKHYKCYFVPSHVFQMAAIKTKRYELIMLKRFMMLLAEKIAELENADLIFTGESLGQVASQTSSNINSESHGIGKAILRPLIGLDKLEIIGIAKKIGTYEQSILPYKDVCSINSKNPKTTSRVEDVEKLSEKIDLERIVEVSLHKASVIEA